MPIILKPCNFAKSKCYPSLPGFFFFFPPRVIWGSLPWKYIKINAKTRSEIVALIFKALVNSYPMGTDSKECTPNPHKLNTIAHKQK